MFTLGKLVRGLGLAVPEYPLQRLQIGVPAWVTIPVQDPVSEDLREFVERSGLDTTITATRENGTGRTLCRLENIHWAKIVGIKPGKLSFIKSVAPDAYVMQAFEEINAGSPSAFHSVCVINMRKHNPVYKSVFISSFRVRENGRLERDDPRVSKITRTSQ